jgi:demethylmenaquinone methyltransferase/2-methoxy-6-polyprenyl-1,4-benzoquinol methylase
VIIDVATGTADLAIAAMRLDPVSITGIDISQNMLEIGQKKIIRKRYEGKITLCRGNSEHIEFSEQSFDVAMVAFGVRNFTDPLRGLKEMYRVLRPAGIIMVLEFSKPARFPFRQFYFFYFLKIVPVIGRLFSKDRNAYSYLPESVRRFPENEQFIELLSVAGFSNVVQKRVTGGIASIYTGFKF